MRLTPVKTLTASRRSTSTPKMSLPFAPRAVSRALRSPNYVCGACRRGLTTSTRLQSGHSKWATIKHDKAKNDAAKNKQRSVFSHEIILATKRESVILFLPSID